MEEKIKLYISNEKDREAVALVLLRNGYTVKSMKKVAKKDDAHILAEREAESVRE